nr:MAG TPA: minor capsid protein [Caudoviricetes sp.]
MQNKKIKEMIKRNGDYWSKRFLFLEKVQNDKNIEYFHNLEKQYNGAIQTITDDINNWYMRFAENNKITLTEAKRLLTTKELKEFKWTVEEYIQNGKENALNQRWVKQLENASARVHINRLESLRIQMQNQVEVLMGNEIDDISRLMTDIYQDTYYRSIYEIQKGLGVGSSFTKLDTKLIEKYIHKPWTPDGSNFSERIWGSHRPQLVKELETTLTQSVIRGDNPKKITSRIAKRFKVKQHQAENLVLTETAFFQSKSTIDSFSETGIKEYQNDATLDNRTSETCRYMDGTHFKISEYKLGVTAPPFHNRCRTVIIPYFDDEFTVNETRAARNKDGNIYSVPGNMKYSEWKNKHVYDAIPKQEFKLFEKYVEILALNAPTIDEFMKIRYNKKEWEQFIAYSSSIKSGELSALTSFDLYKKINNEIDKNLIDITTSNGIKITNKSKHFISRVIGSVEQRRNGVNVKDVLDVLQNPARLGDIRKLKNGKSQRFIGDLLTATVNPDTGVLIQVNPTTRRKGFK